MRVRRKVALSRYLECFLSHLHICELYGRCFPGCKLWRKRDERKHDEFVKQFCSECLRRLPEHNVGCSLSTSDDTRPDA